ncbi:hypothetical protein ACD591_01140 [Rufibacter glacialis]|uniref:DUF4595 domain-containing protein n=1 Tax=Rufibacter glacialis TaxID=1259555 RepID=A0A5M8QKJ7_9BACT|nr:hypothetical protein [Rufibacter glacialis]KAA6435504.1 hypothetical protein FOE74_06040 [Rufibacter glacialis]GGK64086.1 hypothetical protein GCM10011405_10080 [Rufibacter glacialis]
MRYRLLFLLILAITFGCSDKEEQEDPAPTQKPFQPVLPKLERPEVILNELAKGEFHNGTISAIHLRIPGSPPRQWVFEPDADRSKMRKVTRINPYYTCEETQYTYRYHPGGLIDEIVSVRDDCKQYTVTWVYKYNYEQGLLVSITGKSFYNSATAKDETYYVVDNFFSYYPNGKVKDIYSSFRSAYHTWEYGFQRRTFAYDERGNITEVWVQEQTQADYHDKYTLEYDGNPNPLKGFFIVSSVQSEIPGVGFAPALGPRALSNNCVVSIKTEKVNNSRPPFTEYLEHNASGGRVVDFGNAEDTARGYRYLIFY